MTSAINRYYDPATGQFLSVDPDVAETGQPYSYGEDDPVNSKDITGLATVGICGGFNVQGGPANVAGSGCLTRTIDASGEDDIGLTSSVGVGPGIGVGASGGFFYQVSNATNLQELKGPFNYLTEAIDVGGGETVTVFWNANYSVEGIEIGLSLGGSLEIAGGVSETVVNQFYGTISANIARGVWDAFNPNLAIDNLLTKARKLFSSSATC